MNLFKKVGVAIVGMAMAIGVGVAVSGKAEVKAAKATSGNWSVTITAAPAGVTVDTASAITLNSMAWTVTTPYSDTSSSRWALGTNKNYGTVTLTTTAYTDPVSKVSLGWYTNSKKTVNWACSVGATSLNETLGNDSGAGSGTKEFDFSATKPTGTITLTASSPTGGFAITSISITSGATTKSISVGSATMETNVSVSKTASISYANLTSNISVTQSSGDGGAVTFSSTSISYGTGTGDTELTITGSTAGTVTVTLTSDTANATITVTVRNYAVYTKLTSDAQIYSGLVVVLAKDGYVANELANPSSGNYVLSATAGVLGNDSIAHNGAMEFTITGTVQDGWTLTNSSNALGITSGSSGNKMALGSGTTTWSISYSAGLFVLTNSISGDFNLLQYNYNGGSPRFSNYKTSSNMQNINLYAKTATNNIYAFIGENMRMGDNALNRETNTGACNSYYATAKAAFNGAGLTNEERAAFFNEANTQYSAARARLTAWAAANGESFDTTEKILKASRVVNGLPNEVFKDNSATTLIVILSIVGIIAMGGYLVFRKRKEDR